MQEFWLSTEQLIEYIRRDLPSAADNVRIKERSPCPCLKCKHFFSASFIIKHAFASHLLPRDTSELPRHQGRAFLRGTSLETLRCIGYVLLSRHQER
jgi:hypothetical protein